MSAIPRSNRKTKARLTIGSLVVVVCLAATMVTLSLPTAATSPASTGANRAVVPAVSPGHRGLPMTTLSSLSPTFDGYFGASVAAYGNVIVVGAEGENDVGGHAYIYDRATKLTTVLSSPNPDTCTPSPCNGGLFGSSVAVNGNVVVVGADAEPVEVNASPVYYAGHAYVYNIVSKVYLTLTSPSPTAYGFFGWTVAVGSHYVAVGAPDQSPGGLYAAGEVYLFNASTGVLVSTLTSPNEQTDGQFGYSVSMSRDTLVVGAPTETAGGFAYAGHAYIYNLKKGRVLTLTNPNVATNSNPEAFYYGDFGFSVAVNLGDTRVVVGAWEDAVSGLSYAGHAYTFRPHNGALVSTLTSPDPQTNAQFGSAVGAGVGAIVVGAWNQTVGGIAGAGQVYLYHPGSGNPAGTLSSPNAVAGGVYGLAVAATWNGIVVGAGGETAGGSLAAGHAYIYNNP